MSGKRKAEEIEYLHKKLQRLQKKIDLIREDSDSSESVNPEEEDQREEDPFDSLTRMILYKMVRK